MFILKEFEVRMQYKTVKLIDSRLSVKKELHMNRLKTRKEDGVC